jgi:hypothetical protein
MFKKLDKVYSDQGFKGSKSQYQKSNFDDSGFNFLKLIESWPLIVGERLAENTIPLKNKGKTLTILTNHSAYSQQLKMMEEVLKKKIFEHFPQLRSSLKSLQFQTSSRHFDEEAKELKEKSKSAPKIKTSVETKLKIHKYSPEYKKLSKEADDEFQELEEGEFKDSLKSIFIQSKISED